MTRKDIPHAAGPDAQSGVPVAAVDWNAGRRAFIRSVGFGAVGAVVLGAASGVPTEAQAAITDIDILNFALNLEYLEAEYYLRAAFGRGLRDADVSGVGRLGEVSATPNVPVRFQETNIRDYAREIALDEEAHVKFLRSALGSAAVARPRINLNHAFDTAARAAGLVGPNEGFNPFANDNNFLLGAFIFEDVGVTAYKGAAPLLDSKAYLAAAAGLLAVEAYHAGEIRTILYAKGLFSQAKAISDLRDMADGDGDKDQGIRDDNPFGTTANIVPTDANGLAFDRTPQEVLRIVYLNEMPDRGGFFPGGLNGAIH